MIRVFFDTNIYFSALISPGGTTGLLVELAAQGFFNLLISQEVLDELRRVLKRPKAKKTVAREFTEAELDVFVESLSKGFFNVGPLPKVRYVANDPKDDHVVNAAILGQVDYLVSGDKKHVLPLRDHPEIKGRNIEVVSPGEFIELIKDEFL